jgi:hypothetical protein
MMSGANGANLSPLVSMYPLLNTPVAALRPRVARKRELLILTQIYRPPRARSTKPVRETGI